MRIFVTGGSSGIGAWVVKDRLARGDEVVAPPRSEFDLTSRLPNMGRFDAIVHCAAEMDGPDDTTWYTNVTGTKNLMMWMGSTGAERIVLMSTGSVVLGVDGIYNWSKDAQELVTVAGATSIGMQCNIIRPYFPYGPWTNPKRMVMSMILDAFNPVKKRITVVDRLVNPIYITDLMGVVDDALMRKDGRSVMNCGGPDVVSMTRLVEIIISLIGRKHEVETIGDEPIDMSGPKVGTTSLVDGLDKTVEWIREELI